MDTLGHIGLFVLLFLTIIWMLGIRIKLETGLHSIFGSFLFTLCSLILLITDLNNLYAWLMIPLCYFSIFLVGIVLGNKTPIISNIIIFLSLLYSGVIRIGIDKNKIKKAYIDDMVKHINKLN